MGARSIVIAGTHGKTTTTSLAGWLLTHGGADPSVLIGGIAENFSGSYRIGGGREFVIEGDEYDSAFFDKTAKFLKYLPDIVVVNNIEYDHADIYPDLESIRVAFRRLVNLIPRRGLLLVGADNGEALALRPSRDVRWRHSDCRRARTGRHTTSHRRRIDDVQHQAQRDADGAFEIPLLGAYNVRNALAAVAVGVAVGVNVDTLRQGLLQFKGVRRRMQLRGVIEGVGVYDDFAHHPTAIAETLAGVRSAYPDRRVWAISSPDPRRPAGASSSRSSFAPSRTPMSSSSRGCSVQACRRTSSSTSSR